MDIPVGELIKQFSGFAVQYVSSEIRTLGERPASGDSPEHTHPEGEITQEVVRGCPACRIHDAASTAKGHLDGIVAMAQERGTIPDVMRPELLLARKNLDEAEESIQIVRDRAPSLDSQCTRVSDAIGQAREVLPLPDDLDTTNARQALTALQAVHREATVLGVDYFELERGSLNSAALRRWYDDSKARNLDADTALSRLKEVLDGE